MNAEDLKAYNNLIIQYNTLQDDYDRLDESSNERLEELLALVEQSKIDKESLKKLRDLEKQIEILHEQCEQYQLIYDEQEIIHEEDVNMQKAINKVLNEDKERLEKHI